MCKGLNKFVTDNIFVYEGFMCTDINKASIV
jgi:hypothetical protein